MISASSNPSLTSLSTEEFFLHFTDPTKVVDFFICKPVKHLKVVDSKISFILKRVAQFEFIASREKSRAWVQFDSTSTMVFKSAVRFSYDIESRAVTVHYETDTNVFMEFFLQERISKLVTHLGNNISEKFC